MWLSLLFLLLFIALTVSVIWLTLRARRSTRPALKWSGLVVGALFSLILLVVSAAGTRGMVNLFMPSNRVAPDLKVELTPGRVARGQEIANWCAACHSLNQRPPLSGGKNLSDESGMPFGDLYPINLTPAGPLKSWTDGQISVRFAMVWTRRASASR